MNPNEQLKYKYQEYLKAIKAASMRWYHAAITFGRDVHDGKKTHEEWVEYSKLINKQKNSEFKTAWKEFTL